MGSTDSTRSGRAGKSLVIEKKISRVLPGHLNSCEDLYNKEVQVLMTKMTVIMISIM